jgi:signal transduction histidine kinase
VGLRLVRDLVLGLQGEIDHDRNGGRTRIIVTLPFRNPEAANAQE